ncbi:HD-GYP domain-containing protein [Bacillus timonensis]|uniref:HD-GYP domain-containing protein n=1 Tax=Bacillus timonensis TaxID=1033734 RepID=UPI000287F00B|nr:HD-GYP domain-containing protein [Bacillus timonensis]
MRKMISKSTILSTEEKGTLKWFLSLFYLIMVVYDVFYYFIYPKFITNKPVGLPSEFGYVLYLIMFALIPVAIYLSKKDKHYLVKYVVVLTYLVLSIFNDVSFYLNSEHEYKSGNIAEMFVILFSPIFISKRFYYVVTIGALSRYLITGAVLQETEVFFLMLLTTVFAVIALIFLFRFQSYVNAVKTSYDEQLEGMVKGVIAALELKDPYTRGHSERVASYALSLAKEVKQFSNDELTAFNYACLLHDIGKVNIPDQILMKPSKLTNEEFEVIKTHPVVGAEAVKNIEGLKGNICVIRSHHERWDGKGYPDNLQGEDIPLLARIVAIADAFDAMTSSRSYRSALPAEEAFKRIIEGQGTQFDPILVEEFKKVFPSWALVTKNHDAR